MRIDRHMSGKATQFWFELQKAINRLAVAVEQVSGFVYSSTKYGFRKEIWRKAIRAAWSKLLFYLSIVWRNRA